MTLEAKGLPKTTEQHLIIYPPVYAPMWLARLSVWRLEIGLPKILQALFQTKRHLILNIRCPLARSLILFLSENNNFVPGTGFRTR
jgi:hypothetical protein